jgi:predicted nucleic acid-binding protein
MTVFVDTNIPAYATGAASIYRDPSAQILLMARRHPGTLITNAQVLQEVLHLNLRREGIDRAKTTINYLTDSLADNVVAMTSAGVASAANEVLSARLQAADRVHVAVMKRLGIDAIISTDRAFDEVPGIRRLDPLDFATWRAEVFEA